MKVTTKFANVISVSFSSHACHKFSAVLKLSICCLLFLHKLLNYVFYFVADSVPSFL